MNLKWHKLSNAFGSIFAFLPTHNAQKIQKAIELPSQQIKTITNALTSITDRTPALKTFCKSGNILSGKLLQNNGKESPVASFMKFTAHEFKNKLKQKAPSVLNEYKVDWHSRSYFWQPKADWFLLNSVTTIEQKLNYIHLNPMRGKWILVNDPTEYYYSSCRFYEKKLMILNS